MDSTQADLAPWNQRAWALGAIGAAGGLAIYLLLNGSASSEHESLREAAATFLGVGFLAFAQTWTRDHLRQAILIAIAAGAILALVFLWNGTPAGRWSGGENWRIVAALVAAAIFVPLAQAGGEHGMRRPAGWSTPVLRDWMHRHFPYPVVHGHAWTNLLTVGLSVLFAGAFFLMLLLMAELFSLVRITLLREWLGNNAVMAAVWGGAIGASTGLLRDRYRVIASLQAVAMAVLRVAAPVLAVSLALFLAILPLTGLAPLWDATRATTPILLSAVIVALLLANSVMGDGREDEARAPALRLAALVLVVVVAPLAIVAAISTGLRIGQYGWTPERLWAATFVGMACVVAVACLLAVMIGRRNWADGLRTANLWLAFLICGLALLLSTPLVRFDAIATRDQMARLADGRTSADKFDYAGLWFDFGPAGRDAIRQLAVKGDTAAIRQKAQAVQKAQTRDALSGEALREGRDAALDNRLTILPRKVAVEPALRERLMAYDICGESLRCLLVFERGADHAVAVALPASDCGTCQPGIKLLYRGKGDWSAPTGTVSTTETRREKDALVAAIRAGRMDVRDVTWRQLFIDGKPFGDPIPQENVTAPDDVP